MEDKKDTLYQAIQNVQQKAPPIKKTSQGQVGSRSYKYANLNDTWEPIKVLLKENGLVVISSPVSTIGSGVGNYFKTTIHHIPSDKSITEIMPMVLTKQDPQAIGAAITYYRRYMLQSMLGLIPDDDNDAREQRLATAEQKLQIVGAVKIVFPDINTPDQINKTLESIIGKHPSMIREDEAEDCINLIKAYKS